MTTARELLAAGPEGYTAARDAAVKELRASGDRPAATELKSLTRPGIALWGVLAAGADEKAVRAAFDATSALADVQSAASDRARLTEVNQARREAIDRVADAALDALAAHGAAGGAGLASRRDEVRSLVDRLTRHPELADSWLDATLRQLPEDDLGFGAFTGFPPSAPASEVKSAKSAKSAKKAAAGGRSKAKEEPTGPDPEEIEAAREQLADAERAEADATDQLRTAEAEEKERRSDRSAAEKAVEAARKALADAESTRDGAVQAHEDAERVSASAKSELDEAKTRHRQARSDLDALTR